MSYRRDDWIDEDEYPDDRDIADLGDDAPADYDPRTIGYVGNRPSFWSPARIVLLIVVLVIMLIMAMLRLFLKLLWLIGC